MRPHSLPSSHEEFYVCRSKYLTQKEKEPKFGSREMKWPAHRGSLRRTGCLFISAVCVHFRVKRGESSTSCMSYVKTHKTTGGDSLHLFHTPQCADKNLGVFNKTRISSLTCPYLTSYPLHLGKVTSTPRLPSLSSVTGSTPSSSVS